MRTFAMGAYGTNNVGDEAIFEGLARSFPDCTPFHLGKASRSGSVFFEEALTNPNFFQEHDHLIIGGGGLLYDKRAIDVLIRMGRAVRTKNGRVDILGIGCEAAHESYYAEIRELVALADDFSVRTTISQSLIKDITGRGARLQNDFAFALSELIGHSVGSGDSVPHIGVVTSGDYEEKIPALLRVIRTYTSGSRIAKFIHIPHSRAYFSARNNDAVVGHSIWSSIDIYHGGREDLFVLEPFSACPLKVLSRYKTLDGVISRRLHGLIFAKIVNVPHLILNGNTLKNRSFYEDHKSALTFVSMDDQDTFEQFEAFYACAVAHKEALQRRSHEGMEMAG
jgi:polysaccharide pyruvyl transferase WcaK-like protein